ncbi:MAG TPA: hypothetical protein ENJ95_06095 [Bacteroidetes bacterium]|nr:hypothetical protein [Bacteroidota bacterium]
MKPLAFRTFCTLIFALLFLSTKADDNYNRDEIQPRLEAMECIVKPRYTTAVENYIKGYFARGGMKAQRILARTVLYFPIFEKQLAERGMPDDLKYLAVVESGLNPMAVSRVGATGLWQFMKETGAGFGLKINSKIDERSCPVRSTEAALEYLSRAYQRFGSWELAIASYNCGAGNVRRAMRRAGGSNDYWKISKYLPRETRNFVPAFLGAAYMVKYHHLHGVAPEYPDFDLQVTEGQLIYQEMKFETIAAVAKVPVHVVEKLNPAYKKGYVPANSKGHWVVLPRRVMQALRDYTILLRPDNGPTIELPPLPELMGRADYFPDSYYFKTFYKALGGDSLHKLGEIFSCSGHNLKIWNGLHSDEVEKGQELIVWFPKELLRYQPFKESVEALPPVSRSAKEAGVSRPAAPKMNAVQTLNLHPFQVNGHPSLAATAYLLASGNPLLAKKQKFSLRRSFDKIKYRAGEKQFFKKKKKKG